MDIKKGWLELVKKLWLGLALGYGPFAMASNPVSSSMFVLTKIGGGITAIPSLLIKQADYFGSASLDFLLGCRQTKACIYYSTNFFRTHFDFSLSNDRYYEDSLYLQGGQAEQHLPYFNVSMRVSDFQFTPRLYVSFGNLIVSRARRFLNEYLNAQLSLGLLSVDFGKQEGIYHGGLCSVGLTGPGYKAIRYSSGAVPFDGWFVLGVQQGCQLVFGSTSVQGVLSYSIQSSLQVGRSGSGQPEHSGNFGALNSESYGMVYMGLWVHVPMSWYRLLRIWSIEFGMKIGVYYHMNRGCLGGDSLCSSNISPESPEVRVLLMMSVSLGHGLVPSVISTRASFTSTRVSFFQQGPLSALVRTPSQDL